MQRRLIIFTRYPEPGQTKTRLIPALGADGAAAWQREMTRHIIDVARRLRSRFLRMPYGDQSLFVPHGLFRELSDSAVRLASFRNRNGLD